MTTMVYIFIRPIMADQSGLKGLLELEKEIFLTSTNGHLEIQK